MGSGVDQLITPALYALFGTMLMAAFMLIRDWLAKRSAFETQETLKITLKNIDLNAEIAAKQAKIVADELASSQHAQRDQAEALAAQAVALEKVAQDTADSKVAQAAIAVKVDGQMTALNKQIAALTNALEAEKQAGITEREKAATLAVQTEKDRGEAAAKLAEAKVATTNQEKAAKMDPNGSLVVNVPASTLPVEPDAENPLILPP